MRSRGIVAIVAVVATLAGAPSVAAAAITVTRAELNGTALRVEGAGAVPNATVTVSSPQQSTSTPADANGAFRVETDPFTSSTCKVTVSDGSTSATASLAGCTPSQPPPPPPAPVLSAVAVNPASVVGGNNSTGTVSMSAPAQAATTVTLASSSAVATVPASVTIAAGASSAPFTITTTAVNASTAVTISGSSGGRTVSATLTVTPAAAPGAPVLSSLTLNPTSVPGGSTSTGTVSLSAPAQSPTTVTLSSSNLNVAGVPASVTIATGATSATFTVTTATAVPASSTVTITASSGGATKQALLTVTGSQLAISTAGLSCVNGVCELGPGNVGTFFAGFISSSGGTGPTPFDWNLIAGSLPDGLTLNDPRQCGVHCVSITGTPTTVQKATFTIQVTDGAGASAQQAFSITINPPRPLVVTTPANCCPAGTLGTSYAIHFFADGGVQPYSWSLATGQFPPGLALDPSGLLSGTPSARGTFTFTVRVTDAAGAQATGGPFTITIG